MQRAFCIGEVCGYDIYDHTDINDGLAGFHT